MLSLHLSSVQMLLLPRSRILEPDLSHSLTQSRHVGYSLEVLPIRIAVQLKVRLENRQLFLGERRPHSLRLTAALMSALGVTAFCDKSRLGSFPSMQLRSSFFRVTLRPR